MTINSIDAQKRRHLLVQNGSLRMSRGSIESRRLLSTIVGLYGVLYGISDRGSYRPWKSLILSAHALQVSFGGKQTGLSAET